MSRESSPLRSAICLAVFLSLASAAALRAQDEPATSEPKLTLHGFLTQAYARSEGHQILGIPEDGTSDYRTAALQVAYAMSPKDKVVVQVSHERFGESPFRGLKEDIELDWAFYERRFTDQTSLRVGKVQIPLGIYNEIRDVGTILPFYRPPFNFYGEGVFTSETVEGVVLSHTFAPESVWRTEVDVYYGGYDLLEIDPMTAQTEIGRVENNIGAQLWVSTPLPGLRVGVGGSRFELEDTLLNEPGQSSTLKMLHASVDGSFISDRLRIRSEAMTVDLPIGRYRSHYIHVGGMVAERWVVNAQADFSRLKLEVPLAPPFDKTFNRDYAIGVNFEARSDLVVKLESHWTRGFRVDDPINLFFDDPIETRYAIVSISASF